VQRFPESALVTGGASGIGRAIVERLEAEGAKVQSLDLQDGFDVADPAAWESVAPADLACLNAGVVTHAEELTALTDDEYRRVMGANVDGVVYGVRRLAAMMAPGSAIVVTASLAGLVPAQSDVIYTLTKHAVVGFVRAVAPQLSARAIRINMVNPGFVDTPMVDDVRDAFAEAGFPLLDPRDVAEAVLLAARDEETGQAWVVQPGREPLKFRFPNVPGPRVDGVGMAPPV
jgi:NAD(P)-dependent dehydrogenase (short-subunit alcohol dehydrogenase family)